MEYGLSTLILSVCINIYNGLRRTFTKNGDFVMAAAILTFIYGKYTDELFNYSYLSIRFPDVDFSIKPTDAQISGIERGFRMIKDKLEKTFSSDLQDILIHFGHLYKVNLNGKLYLSEETDYIKTLKKKYNVSLED